MKILITGVAGFIGSNIAKRFISEGYKVIGIDDLSNGNISNVPYGVEFINLNLIDTKSLSKIPQDCNYILHLAGQSSGEISYHKPIDDLEKNTISTLNLINYAIKNKIKKFLYASSMSVYGDANSGTNGVSEDQELKPKSCYGIGKLSAENYLNVYKDIFPSVSLRMFNVYGPGQDMENMKQGMVSIFLSQAIKSGEIIIKGSISRFRDFIYIDDVVEIWYRATLYEDFINQTINVGTGKKTTVNELISLISSITKVEKFRVEGETPCDQLGIYANNSKLKKFLDYEPKVEIFDGLTCFNKWAMHNKI